MNEIYSNFNHLGRKWKDWQYKNFFLLVVSLILFFYFAETDTVQNFIKKIGNLSYFGAFIIGIFFVSTFTVAPAMAILYNLAETLNPLGVVILAGSGAVIGDYLIFRFLKDKIFKELNLIFSKLGGSFIKKIFLTPYFAWLLPIAGAFIIASPLPDEAGISLLGLSKVKNWQFILISFLLNAVGIFLIITLARSF